MNQDNRIWCEQDLSELYEDEPQIVTSQTYTTIFISLQSSKLPVKIPTGASKQSIAFLLFKAIYFYYLDTKHNNPLYQTAIISGFQSIEGYDAWYRLYWGSEALSKNTVLKCIQNKPRISINGGQGNIIAWYLPLGIIQESRLLTKFLTRSTQTSLYSTTCIFPLTKSNTELLLILEPNYKLFHHPFIVPLIQIIKSKNYAYFVFGHAAHSMASAIKQTTISLNQVKLCFVQLVLALIFLEQQQIILDRIHPTIDMISISQDGHLFLNEKVLQNYGQPPSSPKNKIFDFISQFYNMLICESGIILDESSEDLQESEQIEFAKYLEQLLELSAIKRVSISTILTHKYLQINIQKILSKSIPLFNTGGIKLHQLPSPPTSTQVNTYFLCKNTEYITQKFGIHKPTQSETIIKKYGVNNSNCKIDRVASTRRLVKTNSTLSLRNNQDNPNSGRFTCQPHQPVNPHITHNTHNNGHSNIDTKSPYFAVLRKEGKRNKGLRV